MTTAEFAEQIENWAVSDSAEVTNFAGEVVEELPGVLRLKFKDGSVVLVPSREAA